MESLPTSPKRRGRPPKKSTEVVQVSTTITTQNNGNEFDWLNAPLEIASERLNDLKREYDRATQIILQRTSRLPHSWTCWSQQNKSLVPRSVLFQCKKDVPDGKWVSKDDGHKDKDGNLDPIVTCSMLCHEVYLKNKPVGGLGRR